ncbi:hypothetical protein BAY61_12040 [Prauserella marina]|uniref:3alpha(Or 20beta)-hydroxysteroid dehydrogenase n=1 Tax=Prauserella marina TaxID=530584 RepID=A0A222VNV7_9PSEU|nr:SDR family oxidoreductase [Prauserella marina]ASR35606.1 hypothetical protein BAY61_12040 [Prauserella marina]PWV84534.1 3alpha(or 20beta)-hydroxysteroid dehydrogenase [Prauserella marina]SDC19883.1 3alpha(or 20beta)-hydroxysteroid dehydrogenase [Prauserella marina]
MKGRLDGKVAVVTGGAHGIGAAIVERFVSEGARVTIADLAEKGGTTLAGRLAPACRFTRCDVTSAAEVAEAIESTVAEWGRLDIMVNNAGFGAGVDVVDTDEHTWRRVIAVNLDGTFHGIKHAAPVIGRGGGGAILNLSSVAAGKAMPGMSAYGAAKAGVEALTRTAAAELRKDGIRVNALVPGLIKTVAADRSTEVLARGFGMSIDQYLATRQGRWGTPEEVAAVALHLVSDESSFTSGVLYPIDNGGTA